MTNKPTKKERQVEQLLNMSQSHELAELQKILGGVNFFELSGMKKQEPKHSHFLLELFDPNGLHGWKDAFARAFLRRAGLRTPEDLPEDFYRKLQRDSEYIFSSNGRRVDLLLYAENKVVIIENKVDSDEHDDQLAKYKSGSDVDKMFAGYEKFFVFLTKDGKKPKDDDKDWKTVSYGDVLDSILEAQEVMSQNEDADEYKIILKHYIKFLKKEVIMDINDMPDVKEILDELKKNYPDAVDILAKHYKTDSKFEFVKKEIMDILNDEAACRGLILQEKDGNNKSKKYGDKGRRIQFKTQGMTELLNKQQSWQNPVIYEIACEQEGKSFKAYAYPKGDTDFNDEDMKRIIKLCNEHENVPNRKFKNGSGTHLLDLAKLFTVEDAYDDLTGDDSLKKDKFKCEIVNLLDKIQEIEADFKAKSAPHASEAC